MSLHKNKALSLLQKQVTDRERKWNLKHTLLIWSLTLSPNTYIHKHSYTHTNTLPGNFLQIWFQMMAEKSNLPIVSKWKWNGTMTKGKYAVDVSNQKKITFHCYYVIIHNFDFFLSQLYSKRFSFSLCEESTRSDH